jgi:amino acid adenylation domain-containing protein
MPVVFTSTLAVRQGDFADINIFGEQIYGITQTPQVWLDHQIFELEGTLIFSWDAVEELFPEGLLDDMFEAYCGWLKELATTDAAWETTNCNLTPPAQLAQREMVNDTAASISEEMLHTLFISQVESRADEVAVISSDRTLTYRELYEQASQVGHWLREAGAAPNTLVAVVMEKGWEQVVAVLGILMSGAAYLPVDPELPTERQHYLLAQGQVKLALSQSRLDQQLSWPQDIQPLCVDTADLSYSGRLEVVQKPTDLAYVIYTSGSTGLPKGVVIDHRGAVNTILDINRRFEVTHQDRVLALSALNFDLSVYDIFGLLAVGGAIVMPEPAGRRNPAHWAELMEQHRVSLWDTVPALMQMLVEYQAGRSLNVPLRLVMMSGDWIPLDLPERIKSLWPDIQVMSLGGATEASIWSIYYPIEQVEGWWKSIPYGQPMTNQSFQVLNELLAPCPVWAPGQLYIGGIGLAQGYWRDEEKTQASFITHPVSGERLYKTGDLGRYLPDGNIEFLGREDFQVKVRGHRIELGEIEANLVKHPGVKEVVVTAVGEARGDKQLVAYVVPEETRKGGNNRPIDQAAYGLEEMKGVLTDPVDRLEFKLKQPGLCQLEGQRASIKFPQPSLDEASYLARQSYRQFLAEPVEFEKLGQWLACLMPQSFANAILPKYRYGSAGSLYPVQTYVYLKPERVTGIEGGIYYYHPPEHQLVLLTSEARIGRAVHGGINREIFEQSAFSLFLVGELAAIEPMYGMMARDFCLLEAGYMSQLLMEVAPASEIGLCPIGGLNFESMREYFELRDSQELLHSFLGGVISPEQMRSLPQSEPIPGALDKEIREYLAQKLPGYMAPELYVLLEALPLTSNGKVNRKALPEPDARPARKDFVPPRTGTEKGLVIIWRNVLGVEQIGIEDEFFELGGNSILSIQLITQIRETFQVEAPLRNLFEKSTILSQAEYVDTLITAQRLQAPPDVTESEREEEIF